MSTVTQSKIQGMAEWPLNYAALVHFAEEFGHCNLPQTRVYSCDLICVDGVNGHYHYEGRLGFWLHRQKQALKIGKLSPEHEALLQKIVDEGTYVFIFIKQSN